jgi:hypothetical protein
LSTTIDGFARAFKNFEASPSLFVQTISNICGSIQYHSATGTIHSSSSKKNDAVNTSQKHLLYRTCRLCRNSPVPSPPPKAIRQIAATVATNTPFLASSRRDRLVRQRCQHRRDAHRHWYYTIPITLWVQQGLVQAAIVRRRGIQISPDR